MKNVMKKLFSLVLVAVLLISAVPFQAKADTGITAVYEVDGVDKGSQTFDVEAKTVAELMEMGGYAGYSLTKAGLGGTGAAKTESDVIYSGEKVYIKMASPAGTDNNQTVVQPISAVYYVNGTKAFETQYTVEAKTVTELIAMGGYDSSYTLEKAGLDGSIAKNAGDVIYAGERVHIKLTKAEEVKPISIVVKVESSDNVVWKGTKVPANDEYALVENLISYCWNSSWDDVYTFDHAWSSKQQANVAKTGKIYAGDTVYIMLKAKTTTSGSSSSSGSTTTNKFPYNVYLNIYKGTTVGTPAKTINITSGIALDGKVTLAEVKSLVLNYYTANTSAGITFDGLYLAKGNWVSNYVYDQKYDEFNDINTLRQIDTVYINVMIDNCTAKTTSTSTADSSNPKTGDSIFMPVAVLGISASALATAFFFANKKRLAK